MADLGEHMRRGDVVTAALGSGFGGKPRPALIVQSDRYAKLSTVLLALFTSELLDTNLRQRIQPSERNGLHETSDVMVDVLVTARRAKIGSVIGRLDQDDMLRIDRALMDIMGFA